MNSSTSNTFFFPAGISGFWSKKDTPPPILETSLFQEKCEEVKTIGYELIAIHFAENKRQSYHSALLQKNEEQIVVFCNKYYPIVAFTQPNALLSANDLIQFEPPSVYVAHEMLAAYFNQAPFQVIPSEILRLEVDADNPETTSVVHLLYDVEFAEFAFWEPRSMGDVVFNNWG